MKGRQGGGGGKRLLGVFEIGVKRGGMACKGAWRRQRGRGRSGEETLRASKGLLRD